jgi:NhaA family Na+:H+ antiporter
MKLLDKKNKNLIALSRKLFSEFWKSEQRGSIILIFATLISIILANSSAFINVFPDIWHSKIGFESVGLKLSIEHWVNDGLMAIFFLMVGLEIEREIYIGEFSNIRKALLPIMAALGGMIVPALIHFSLNIGQATQSGIGIPMATDIAFAIGIISLLGNRIPLALKIFLTALAIIDDLGAIIIIAIFYSKGLIISNLLIALGIFALLLIFNRMNIKSLWIYLVIGALMWYFMLQSGIHATISGVLLAFAIPFRKGDEDSPSYKMMHFLHNPVALIIIPIFAFVNSGIRFESGWILGLFNANSLGIMTGLFIGKPLGITLFVYLSYLLKIIRIPESLNLKLILGAGMIAGIGFTMSIFITLLAFDNPIIVQQSKIANIFGSLISGIIGYFFLSFVSMKSRI